MLNTRTVVVAGVSLLSALVVACGSNSVSQEQTATATPALGIVVADTATVTPAATLVPIPEATVTPTPGRFFRKPSPVETSTEGAVRIMNSIFDRNGFVNIGTLREAGINGHPGLVPVLVEAASRTLDPEPALEIANALEMITGERVGGDFVLMAPWYTWLGNQPAIDELPGFDLWKGGLYRRIDPALSDFFYEDVPRNIPLWAVQWGGVAKDGIPPLEMPLVVSAESASYLLPDEPVFGVVINGEARAYPHRIMGWHEMANDVLGGKPISVVF